MGKKHKTDRDRSRSPTRQHRKLDQDSSPRHRPNHEEDDSRRKNRRRSSSLEDRVGRRNSSRSPVDARRQPRENLPSGSPEPPPKRKEREARGDQDGRRQRGDDAASGRGGNNEDEEAWGSGKRERKQTKDQPVVGDDAPVEKQKANLGLSGKLAEDTNTFRGVVIKYSEPAEARKPKIKWRLYQFKGEETLPTLYVHRQSAYLIGRDRLIADIPVDHPSCSKQHAVLQYRLAEYRRTDGSRGKRVTPYIIDLGATNKTYLNNKPIDAERYHELREKDVLKFGYSSREYVLLNDKSADSEESDEQPD